MRHETRHAPTYRTARAVAVARPSITPAVRIAGLTTLIISVLLGLLSGAVWTQLT